MLQNSNYDYHHCIENKPTFTGDSSMMVGMVRTESDIFLCRGPAPADAFLAVCSFECSDGHYDLRH